MITLFFLLGSLFILPPLAQAKDNDDIVQKTDILFKTEAKESPEAKKTTAPAPGGATIQASSGATAPKKTTSSQTVAPSLVRKVIKKVKKSTTTPAKDATPSPAPSVKEPSKDIAKPLQPKKEATDTKTSVSVPSPLTGKTEEASLLDVKQAGAPTGPAEPGVAGPIPSPGGATFPSAAGPIPSPGGVASPSVAGPPPAKEVALLPGTAVVPVSATAGQTSLQEVLQQAYECLQKDKKYEARNLYSQALFLETSEERRQLIRKHLEELNNVLVFSSTPSPDFLVYKVQPGDNLVRIAKQNNTTAELLVRLNRKSSPLVRVGEPLKVLRGKTSLLVDKSDFTLTLLLDGHYLKQYPVGLGKNDKTPAGRFIVENKMKEPTWFSPLDGKVYAYGSPQNILGTRWMGFQNQPGLSGYGIHGTAEPESIGTESSNGCIRMLNQDVEEVYDYVTPGTEVIIQR